MVHFWMVVIPYIKNDTSSLIKSTLSNLDKALELGYDNLDKISTEEAFQGLYQEVRYQNLLQNLKE